MPLISNARWARSGNGLGSPAKAWGCTSPRKTCFGHPPKLGGPQWAPGPVGPGSNAPGAQMGRGPNGPAGPKLARAKMGRAQTGPGPKWPGPFWEHDFCGEVHPHPLLRNREIPENEKYMELKSNCLSRKIKISIYKMKYPG